MITISAINLKGGCSKTTISINLAGVFSEKKKRPILIDCDKQQSATRWAQQGEKRFPFPVIPISSGKASNVKKEIDRLSKEHNADIVLIDTPPQLEDSALIACLLSDIVLIPVTPSPLDLWAAEKAIETIREARSERGGIFPKAILVPSRLMNRTLLSKDIQASLEAFGEPVAPSIFLRVAIPEAAIAGLPVGLYAPQSPSHKEFIDLWKFVNKELPK